MAKQIQFDVKTYVAAIEEEFSRHANKARAAASKAYVRDLFEYYGLTTPQRRDIQKKFHSDIQLPPFELVPEIVKSLWNKKERECQYFAMELYEKYKKQFSKKDVPVFEYMIRNKSWWETVDFISPKLIAALHRKHPELQEENCRRWIKSDHMWLMRAAIIHQIQYREKTNEKLLFELITHCMDHEDFFIRKAIGWSLRQYARTNPGAVKKFVDSNRSKLSGLSQREALKHFT
jgi:3-methyladenine DNA glycosylase AlkD